METPKAIVRPCKYAAVTVLAWAVDFSLFATTNSLIGVVPSLIMSRLIGGLTGYEGHRLLTFSRRGRTLQNFFAYFAQWLIKVVIAIFGVTSLISETGWAPVVSKLIVEVAIFIASYFVLNRIFGGEREPV